MFRRPVVLCLLAVFTNACYKYTSIRTDEIPVGADVRVVLSDDGEQRIRNDVGVTGSGFNGRRLRGHMLRADPDGILLSVPWAVRHNTAWYESQDIVQRIRVSQEEIREVERRQLQRTRTAFCAAGGAAAAALLLVKMLGGRAGGSLPTTNPAPSERIAAAVLLTLPLRLVGVH